MFNLSVEMRSSRPSFHIDGPFFTTFCLHLGGMAEEIIGLTLAAKLPVEFFFIISKYISSLCSGYLAIYLCVHCSVIKQRTFMCFRRRKDQGGQRGNGVVGFFKVKFTSF